MHSHLIAHAKLQVPPAMLHPHNSGLNAMQTARAARRVLNYRRLLACRLYRMTLCQQREVAQRYCQAPPPALVYPRLCAREGRNRAKMPRRRPTMRRTSSADEENLGISGDRFADDTSMLGFRYLHSRYKTWFRLSSFTPFRIHWLSLHFAAPMRDPHACFCIPRHKIALY